MESGGLSKSSQLWVSNTLLSLCLLLAMEYDGGHCGSMEIGWPGSLFSSLVEPVLSTVWIIPKGLIMAVIRSCQLVIIVFIRGMLETEISLLSNLIKQTNCIALVYIYYMNILSFMLKWLYIFIFWRWIFDLLYFKHSKQVSLLLFFK